jgi:UDP-N-acetyl-D-galactosamine dehydrogenase
MKSLSKKWDCIIITVVHKEFKNISLDMLKKASNHKPILIDIRRLYNREEAEKKGFDYYTL